MISAPYHAANKPAIYRQFTSSFASDYKACLFLATSCVQLAKLGSPRLLVVWWALNHVGEYIEQMNPSIMRLYFSQIAFAPHIKQS